MKPSPPRLIVTIPLEQYLKHYGLAEMMVKHTLNILEAFLFKQEGKCGTSFYLAEVLPNNFSHTWISLKAMNVSLAIPRI